MKLDRPIINIICVIVLLLLLAMIIFFGNDPSGILLILMGFTLGPIGVLTEPVHSLTFKLFYVSILIILAGLIILGLKKRVHIWGQALTLVGILGWCYCGMLGLAA